MLLCITESELTEPMKAHVTTNKITVITQIAKAKKVSIFLDVKVEKKSPKLLFKIFIIIQVFFLTYFYLCLKF